MVDIKVSTQYGTLRASIYGGPPPDGATCYANDGKYPQRAHIFGREAEPEYVGATVQTADDDELTINGVAYTVMARFNLDGATWAEDRGGYGYSLKRAGGLYSDGITSAASRAWHDKIVPAIVAALDAATAETDAARVEARAEYRTAIATRIVELRAEADRLAAGL